MAISEHVARVATPLAKAIDAVAFAGEPPRVVTFRAIDEAIHRGLPPGPDRAEMIDHIEYADSLLFPKGPPDDVDIDSFMLIDGVARVTRNLAEKLAGRTDPEAEDDAELARELSHTVALQVVFSAWLVREQLLVVDLATALGADPIPIPSDLRGGGEA